MGKDGAVHRVHRDGGGSIDLAPPEPPELVEIVGGELAVDETHLYWTGKGSNKCIGQPCSECQPCGKIYRARKEEGIAKVEVFAEDNTTNNWGTPRSLAMDEKAVYWTTGDDGRLFRKAKPPVP
jgi:hypothetical protein